MTAARAPMASLRRLATVAIVVGVVLPAVQAARAPVPATASDGATIDQVVAYVLMFVALVLTYLIHSLDASSSFTLV